MIKTAKRKTGGRGRLLCRKAIEPEPASLASTRLYPNDLAVGASSRMGISAFHPTRTRSSLSSAQPSLSLQGSGRGSCCGPRAVFPSFPAFLAWVLPNQRGHSLVVSAPASLVEATRSVLVLDTLETEADGQTPPLTAAPGMHAGISSPKLQPPRHCCRLPL